MGQQKGLRSASPSSVDCYLKCKRLWFRQYFLGDRGPTPTFLARGTSIHSAILDHYLVTGEMLIEHENTDAPGVKFPVLQFTQAAIPYLPKPVSDPFWDPWRTKGDAGLMIEQSAPMGTWTDEDGTRGPEWRQYIDLIEAWPDHAIITDIKTSSDFRYAKTPSELAINVQLVANAKFLFSISDYKEIALRHLYLLTKGKRPKAMPVEVVVTREHVEAEWIKILAIVREMDAYARLAPEDPNVIPPTIDHCSAYGGCRFRGPCGLTGFENSLIQINRTMSKGESMSLIDQMKARASAAVAGSSVPPDAVVIQAVPSAPSGVLGKLLAGKVSAVGQQTVSPLVAGTASTVGSVIVVAPLPVAPLAPQTVGELPGYDPNGILPPDSPIPTSTPEEVAEATGDTGKEKAETVADAKADLLGTKRKRRTKAEMEAARAEEASAQSSAVGVALPSGTGPVLGLAQSPALIDTSIPNPPGAFAMTAEARNVSSAQDVNNPAEPWTEFDRLRNMLLTPDPAFACPVQAIFIDCMPSKGWPGEPAVDLGSIMHSFNGLAAASAQVTDYRLIPYSSNGYLATAIKATMANLPATLFVDSRLPGAAVFLEVCLPYARLVVRGVR